MEAEENMTVFSGFPVAPTPVQVPLNVTLDPAYLAWREVRVAIPTDTGPIMTVRERLLLIHRVSQVAYDGNYGETRRCKMLQLTPQGYDHIRDAFVNVRCIRKSAVIRIGSYTGEGPIYDLEPQPGWVDITCKNDTAAKYCTPGAIALHAELITIDGFRVLKLTAAYANLAILLEPDRDQPPSGRILSTALVGEVRLAYRMFPNENNTYDFVTSPDRIVAIKNIKHFDNASAPTETRHITRSLYMREDPIKEIELMHLVATAPNNEMPHHPFGHPNVMKFDSCMADRQNVYLVMPFANAKDLFSAVHENSLGDNYFTAETAKAALKQVYSGIRFMHSVGICHMDISTENVFIHRNDDRSLAFIVADFGQAMLHDLKEDHALRTGLDKYCLLPPYESRKAPGKKLYYVPETFLCHYPAPFDGFKVDMWQLGVLSIVVFTRSVPFHPDNTYQRIDSWLEWIRRGQLPYITVLPPIGMIPPVESIKFGVGYPVICDFVSQLLRINPTARAIIYDNHPFFN